jgi:hypothetical protein
MWAAAEPDVNSTWPVGSSIIRPVKQGPPAFGGSGTAVIVFALGSNSKKWVGPGYEPPSPAGLAISNTLPFGIRHPGASLASSPSGKSGPVVQVPVWFAIGGGV